ncbi:hypothetical protein GNX71_18630 [Variovorax sp. RKNM96]|uniref:hypothetical protein n=1 Tax=Variovorax sp. RKNM96 TaxID=2681552 RepID=UPI00197DE561|nr:hypothetical protein [Variovorax sp. RKNM96]QSI31484.1 hypothetical protein GNX71_18630 [Variovorax sp. RKNM96]
MTTSRRLTPHSEHLANLSLVPLIDARLLPTKGELARRMAASYRKEGSMSLKHRIGTLIGRWFV